MLYFEMNFAYFFIIILSIELFSVWQRYWNKERMKQREENIDIMPKTLEVDCDSQGKSW